MFANTVGLTLLYLALLGVGVIYAVIILIGGAAHDVNLPGADVGGAHLDVGAGLDQPETSIPSLSPVTVASFVTAFGAFGLIGLGLFNATPPWSLAWAAGGGVAMAVIAHFAFGYFLIAPQGSSEVRQKDIVGAIGEVTTPIPADSVGEVAFVAQGARVSSPARSADGTAIPRGATVIIERTVGGVLLVRTHS